MVGVEKLKAFFAKVEEGLPINLAAERSGIGELYDMGYYRGLLTEAAVYVRADQALMRYSGESLWDLASSVIQKRGEPEKPTSIHTKIVSYMGMMRSGREAVIRATRSLKRMGPKYAFREVFGSVPKGDVDVGYNTWSVSFLLDEDDFISAVMRNSVSEPGMMGGTVVESSVIMPDLRGRAVAIMLDDDWEKRLEHERQHVRLFNMGYDYKKCLRRIPPSMDGALADSYKDYLRDDIVCCMGAGMSAFDIMERVRVTSDALSREFSADGVEDAYSKGVMEAGKRIALNTEEAVLWLPKEYLVPLALNHEFDSLADALELHSDKFSDSRRLAHA